MEDICIVQHFKNKQYYLILNISVHTEREEELVNYKALYSPYTIYSRPKELFFSKVDAIKYPEYAGEDRFSLVNDVPEHINALLNQWYKKHD